LSQWTLKQLLHREIDFRTPDGTRFVSMPNNFSSFIVYIANDRDPGIQAFIRRNVRRGGTFVDVGANIGTYTVRAGQLVGAEGRVVAIEAHPFIFGFLKRNVIINGLSNTVVVHAAVGAQAGVVTMSYRDNNPGETHVSVDAALRGEQVSVQSLDQLLAKLGVVTVDYLKIDVEGFELPVLKGARETIAGSRNLIVQTEMYERHTARYGHSAESVAGLLFQYGLLPQRVTDDGLVRRLSRADLALGGDVLWWRGDSTFE
jgi:FkbM family methyltransferase